MCRCCQSCWEDCYWYCIEERFCFDKNIANYNPDDDDYFSQKKGKGFGDDAHSDMNDERPICEQPGRQTTPHISSKIREEDYRQIQTNVPFLAPEILAVFANSQIFHDSQPNKSLAIVHKSPAATAAIIDEKKCIRDADVEKKLLKRLEGNDSPTKAELNFIPFNASADKRNADELILRPPVIRTSATDDDNDDEDDNDNDDDDGDVSDGAHDGANRMPFDAMKTPILNKRLRNVQSVPYFSFRPASENDIFTIAGTSMTQISMTPEIPSISYSTLPKNYEDTPTIEKYKEATSLYSIQTSNIERANDMDFSMPRYFGKSDMIAQSADNLVKSGPKKIEKSKRLKMLRANLPPLAIHISKERSKEKNIE